MDLLYKTPRGWAGGFCHSRTEASVAGRCLQGWWVGGVSKTFLLLFAGFCMATRFLSNAMVGERRRRRG